MPTNRLILLTVASCTVALSISAALPAQEKTEAERKARVEKFDKKHVPVRHRNVDRHLEGIPQDPEYYKGNVISTWRKPRRRWTSRRCGAAPEFFPEDNKGLWSQWVRGDARAQRAVLHGLRRPALLQGRQRVHHRVRPGKRDQRIVVDVGKTCGWRAGQYVDGKIHGRMDITCPDGTLVAATWNGSPIKQDWIDHAMSRRTPSDV